MSSQNDATANPRTVSPSWTWGSSARLAFDMSGEPGQIIATSAQLAQVSLPEPAVCTLYIQATFSATSDLDSIDTLTLNLFEGIGRVTVPRQITFKSQPGSLSPLEFTIPFIPVHALNVDVTASLVHVSDDPANRAEVEIYFVLSPLTRIPQQVQQLAFGMATPGEADDLDDGLREELETEGPTVQQVMANTLDGEDASDGVDPEEGEPDDDDEPDLTPLQALALRMTERLGRRPTRIELRRAVLRIRQRQQRRGGR